MKLIEGRKGMYLYAWLAGNFKYLTTPSITFLKINQNNIYLKIEEKGERKEKREDMYWEKVFQTCTRNSSTNNTQK